MRSGAQQHHRPPGMGEARPQRACERGHRSCPGVRSGAQQHHRPAWDGRSPPAASLRARAQIGRPGVRSGAQQHHRPAWDGRSPPAASSRARTQIVVGPACGAERSSTTDPPGMGEARPQRAREPRSGVRSGAQQHHRPAWDGRSPSAASLRARTQRAETDVTLAIASKVLTFHAALGIVSSTPPLPPPPRGGHSERKPPTWPLPPPTS